MTNEDKVLIEAYFNTHQFDNSSPDKYLLKKALVVLLNSIEFTNTGLRFSSKKHVSHLLKLTVDSKNIDASEVYVNGLYTVSDGERKENRSFNGMITYTDEGLEKEASLSLVINRLATQYKDIFLDEHFKYIPFTECAHRDYNYLGINCKENDFVVLKGDDAGEFLEEELKLIKKRG